MAVRLYRVLQHRFGLALLAMLLVACSTALGQDKPLYERFAEIAEIARVTPKRALRQLEQLQAETVRGVPAEQAQFLIVYSDIQHGLGKHAEAVALSDQAIVIGRLNGNNDIIAQAMLSKAYALFSLDEITASHQLIWEAEKLAGVTKDVRLRVHILISSGESFAEDGNFAVALSKLQSATTLARQSGEPLLAVISLRSLAILYDQMREYNKGFELLEEAMRAARQMNAQGRLVLLKSTEYALAMDSDQIQRALKAGLSALELQRNLEAEPMIGVSLVNLSDCYLKLRDFRKALSYAQQALAQSRVLNDQSLAATAHINIGQAYLAMGRLVEGKKNMEAGMAWYEMSGNKPELRLALGEYGDALVHAGDLAGAVTALHRERTLLNELFEKRRQKAMMELQGKYEADKRQREIELLRRENHVKSTEIDNRRLQQNVWWLLALVFALASIIVSVLYRKVRHANAQLEIKNQELKQQSARDPLTALYNRRHFQEFMRGRQEMSQPGATQNEEMVSAIFLLDVDHFKNINDIYGHGAGDAVLREIASSLREILRETDMIVRWGGEEFLAFLPAVPHSSLEDVAQRLLIGISACTVDYQGTTLSVNVSIGFAPFPLTPQAAMISWERAVDIVDMTLYLAKGHGRNRAYGVRSFSDVDDAAMAEIEQDIEQAWRAGKVDLSIVLGKQRELRTVS